MEQQFGIRLNGEPDVEAIVRTTGLDLRIVRRDLAEGFVARGLQRLAAERLIDQLGAAGIDARLEPHASLPPAAPAPAGLAPPFNPEVMLTNPGFAAIAPPREVISAPPPRVNTRPAIFPEEKRALERSPLPQRPPAQPPAGIPQRSTASLPAIPPQAVRPRISQPIPPTIHMPPPPPEPVASPRLPWIIAAVMIVVSGVLVAWSWQARNRGVRLLRQADQALEARDYAQAIAAAQKARAKGAGPLADRIEASAGVGARLDAVERQIARGALDEAQRELQAIRTAAPQDPRTLALSLQVAEARLGVAPAAPATVTAALASEAPPSTAADPVDAAPDSAAQDAGVPDAAPAAPDTAALATDAPIAPPSDAPPTEPPPSPASDAPPSAPPRSAATERAADRSTVARLKIVSTPPAEILVDGQTTHLKTPSWIEVAPGRHTLSLRAPNGKEYAERQLKVVGGRQAVVKLPGR